jgi:hypothetical protein
VSAGGGSTSYTRQRRLFCVTIQVYVDEAGLDGKSPFFLFSALLGTLVDWKGFSERWKSALEESPRIAYFKMDEAVGFQKQFYRWSESKRNQKLIRLAQTFNGSQYGFLEHTVTADLGAIERELKPLTRKPAHGPYFWPFQITIQSVCLSILETSPEYDLPMEFYFDDHVIFGPRGPFSRRRWMQNHRIDNASSGAMTLG